MAVNFTRHADAYLQSLEKTLLLIANQPHLARLRTEYTPPVRIHPWRNHYILYLDQAEAVLIVRILHRASNLTRHLAADSTP